MRDSLFVKGGLFLAIILSLLALLNCKGFIMNASHEEPITYIIRTDPIETIQEVNDDFMINDESTNELLQILPLFIALVIAVGVTIYLMVKRIE